MSEWDIERAERERVREQRKAKWKARENKFWRVFLFTEDGKPKSGFLIYSFCLSFVFLAFYMVSYFFLVDALVPATSAMSVFWGNMITALVCSLAGLLPCCLIHLLLKEKRLAFAAHIWLCLYAVASFVALLIILKDQEAISAFIKFFCWFVVMPVGLGTVVTALLRRKDYTPPRAEEEEPAWRKYTKKR